jgi:hypothetical protein
MTGQYVLDWGDYSNFRMAVPQSFQGDASRSDFFLAVSSGPRLPQ